MYKFGQTKIFNCLTVFKNHDMILTRFENLSAYSDVSHFVTTRRGGVSDGRFESMNLGFNVGDEYEKVRRNFMILAGMIGAGPADFVIAKQTHSANVAVVEDLLDGADNFVAGRVLPDTDAMVTSLPCICIMVRVADCVPVLLYDPEKHIAGVVHSGWRGTLKGVAKKTVQVMKERFGCRGSVMKAAIGPSAGPCCYEVGDDVTAMAEKVYGGEGVFFENGGDGGKPRFDLWQTNRYQLADAGVDPGNIEIARECTICGHDKFFSARHYKGYTGRMGAGMMLTGSGRKSFRPGGYVRSRFSPC